jgi:hypothetical protein
MTFVRTMINNAEKSSGRARPDNSREKTFDFNIFSLKGPKLKKETDNI